MRKIILILISSIMLSTFPVYSDIFGSVSGVVTDEETGKAINGVTVYLYGYGADNMKTITNNQGYYCFKRLRSTAYAIEFSPNYPYCFETDDFIIKSGSNILLNKKLKTGGGTVSGKVLHKYSKLPIVDAKILIFGKFAGKDYSSTKDDGSYSLGNEIALKPSNNYYLTVDPNIPNIAFKVILGIKIDKRIETKIPDIYIDIIDQTGIEGRVTSSINGNPIYNAHVYIFSSDKMYPGTNKHIELGNIRTDCSGNYAISNLEAGNYKILITPEIQDGWKFSEFQSYGKEISKIYVKYGRKTRINAKLDYLQNNNTNNDKNN